MNASAPRERPRWRVFLLGLRIHPGWGMAAILALAGFAAAIHGGASPAQLLLATMWSILVFGCVIGSAYSVGRANWNDYLEGRL